MAGDLNLHGKNHQTGLIEVLAGRPGAKASFAGKGRRFAYKAHDLVVRSCKTEHIAFRSTLLASPDGLTADTMHYMLPLCSLAGLAALCDAPAGLSRTMPREKSATSSI